MGSNFLLKEENFRKINEALEIKTNELMKEYESVMKLQDQRTDSPTHQQTNTRGNVSGRSRRHRATTVSSSSPLATQKQSTVRCGQYRPQTADHLWTNTKDRDPLSLGVVDGKGGGEVLGSDKCLGTEALISYLRANVKVLQEEVQSLQADLKSKAEEFREQQAQLKGLEEESAKWRQLATNNKQHVRKLEHQCSVSATKQQQRETENVALRKEVESLRKELKTSTQAASSSEVRLNRHLEEMEKLKASLKQIKQEKKEFYDENRKKTDELLSVVKRLERQKLELIIGFKKQMQLIDNLARQKMHLETGRVIQFAEKEFLKLLDSVPENEDNL